MGRILGIDPGIKRVGLSLSDPLKMIASPFKLLYFESITKLVQDVCVIVKEKDVEKVIIGLPVREDGEEGEGCEHARQICQALQEMDIDTVLWDERYSSKIASDILKESGIKAKNTKNKLDTVAASVLLENYLSFLRRS